MKNPIAFSILLTISIILSSCGQKTTTPTGNTQTDALFRATREGNTDMVKALLSSGADVNATDERDSTPLLEAARYGHEDVCRGSFHSHLLKTQRHNALLRSPELFYRHVIIAL